MFKVILSAIVALGLNTVAFADSHSKDAAHGDAHAADAAHGDAHAADAAHGDAKMEKADKMAKKGKKDMKKKEQAH